MDMALLLIFIAVFGYVQACTPTPASTPAPATGKREVEHVEVTVVTKIKYDPSLNDSHLHTLRMMLDDYARTNGVAYNKELVKESVKNEGGKFAVVYTVLSADCGEVNNFARGAKSNARFITHIRVKCGGKPEFQID